MTNTVSVDALSRFAQDQGKVFLEVGNKVAFITGAGGGIGQAMARIFASGGARLALLDIDSVALKRIENELRASYGGLAVQTYCAAVNDDLAVEESVVQAEAYFGGIDFLLNNAGISMNRPTLDLPTADWRRAIDINLNGIFYCAQAVGRRMVEQGHGVILNTSSMYGVVAAPERAAYCASKAAVAMLTKVMAIEWGSAGVRVNAIAPGYVRTALVDELVQAGRMDLQALIKRTPIGRLGTPQEIATLALFLCSDHASFVTGQVMVADGGWSAYSYI